MARFIVMGDVRLDRTQGFTDNLSDGKHHLIDLILRIIFF